VTLHAEIKIDTPWFLSRRDGSSIDKTWQEPMPFDHGLDHAGASRGQRHRSDRRQKGVKLLAPGWPGRSGCEFPLHVQPTDDAQRITIASPNLREDLPIVSIDSTITVDFAQPVSNDTLIRDHDVFGRHGCRRAAVQDLTSATVW